MATLQEKKFSDFKIVQKEKKSAKEISKSCLQHVPYSNTRSIAHDLPKLMDITNSNKRVYLREQQQDRVTEGAVENQEALYSGFDSKRFLDLGVAPLQRIINELRSLSAENTDEHYDHRAAKAAGLVNYCEFLQGDQGLPNVKGK